VQVDTASGAYNDIEAIGKAIKAAGHPALFMVDARGLARLHAVRDGRKWGIDVAMSGSQKGLMTPPGLGFVAANDRAREVHKKANLRTPYWDWTEREGSRALPQICRHRAGASAVRAAPGDRHAVRGGLENVFLRHRLLGEAVRRAVGGVGRGPGARLQHRRARASAPTP
jgi:alanine-glyoxylate transaminase/serine-glyoxylate transaminase/serine-pyruvate transaminase